MKDCLVDVLNARDTVLHVFPIVLEDQDGTPKAVDPEREALRAHPEISESGSVRLSRLRIPVA